MRLVSVRADATPCRSPWAPMRLERPARRSPSPNAKLMRSAVSAHESAMRRVEVSIDRTGRPVDARGIDCLVSEAETIRGDSMDARLQDDSLCDDM